MYLPHSWPQIPHDSPTEMSCPEASASPPSTASIVVGWFLAMFAGVCLGARQSRWRGRRCLATICVFRTICFPKVASWLAGNPRMCVSFDVKIVKITRLASIYLSSNLAIQQSSNLSIYLSIYLSNCLSLSLSLSVSLSLCLSASLSLCLSDSLPACLPVCLSLSKC